jgi:hypothetical protein
MCGGTPKSIVHAHPPDQCPQFRMDLRPTSRGAGFPAPAAAKSSVMPAHKGLRGDSLTASPSLGQPKREVNIGEGALGASCLPEMVIQSRLDATGGLAMPTTILAYVIAIVGLVLIVAGARDMYLLRNEET